MQRDWLVSWTKRASCCAGVVLLFVTCGLAQTAFNTNVRVGFQGGDNWEPSMVADNYGHLYVVFYQEPNSPTQTSCPGCNSHLLVQRSDDGGNTWTNPVMIAPVLTNSGGQADLWMQLDQDGKTIWVSFFNGYPQVQIEVVKSSDLGVTWSTPISITGNPQKKLDKPVSAIRGSTHLVCYDDYTKMYAAVSYDAWTTWNIATAYTLTVSKTPGLATSSKTRNVTRWRSWDCEAA